MEEPVLPQSAATAATAATAAAARVRQARGARQRVVSDLRRSLVLDAAREAFLELGLEGASLREIARRAGYTPGAIYTYFASKEEIYGALLGESLDRLERAVRAAPPTVQARARAVFDFYLQHPRDLDLGFYLFNGVRPRGLTPELDARLNARLREALSPLQESFAALGLSDRAAQTELTSVFAHAVGLLVLNHTGRIRVFGQRAQALFDRHLDALSERLDREGLERKAGTRA